ncbi:MAG: CapA family protein [Gammaproteobacteria bacterium]|nr:CapA family protein [Gammaproteobacteria bacterium]
MIWLVCSLVLLSGCASSINNPHSQTTKTIGRSTPEHQGIPIAANYGAMRIRIAAVGDIMLGTDYPENHLPDDDGISFLSAVTPALQSADIAFGNLEGVLMDGGEPVKKCNDPAACYLFRSPARYAQHLAKAGFTIVSLANNHARDFGEEGRDASMAALNAAGLYHSGREGSVASWQQGDLKIAFIAFSPTKGSWPLLDTDLASWAVSGLAAKHDLVIVSFHGGAEGFDGAERIGFSMEYAYGEPRGNVIKFAHAVIDAGADLVLGHGPHVPRAVELYNDRLIAYSLGNFATYYGINVRGTKGYAPLIIATLNGKGEFIAGQLLSNKQIRPGGPQPDSGEYALNMIRDLSRMDFPDSPLKFMADGSILIKQ